MSIRVDKYTTIGLNASSLCFDRVIPVSISPIEFARGNGSNSMNKYPPLQISKVSIDTSLFKCSSISNEKKKKKSVPTIKLK
jgi:hypothetical protein